MNDLTSRIKFVQSITLSPGESLFRFTHELGEAALPWNSITHAFLVKWERDSYRHLPLLVLTCGISDYFYYIDGNPGSAKTSETVEAAGNTSSESTLTEDTLPAPVQAEDRASAPTQADESSPAPTRPEDSLPVSAQAETELSDEERFRRVVEEVSSHFVSTFTDEPLTKYLNNMEPSIPEFRESADIIEYCSSAMKSHSAPVRNEGALLKIPERIEKGMLIDHRFTVIDVFTSYIETVCKVLDPDYQEPFLIRTLAPEYCSSDEVKALFIDQARFWTRVSDHRNVVKAELLKSIDGIPCLFTELAEGRKLQELIRSESLSVKSCIEVGIQICEGLEQIFRGTGITHGDVRPYNCIVTEESILKLDNCGQARILDHIAGTVKTGERTVGSAIDSYSHPLCERASFMAPELFDSIESAGICSDIYSFGVTMYRLLTGINPFTAEDISEIVARHRAVLPPEPERLNPEVPESLSRLVMNCIEKEPESRYQDFSSTAAELRAIYRELAGREFDLPAIEKSMGVDFLINRGLTLMSSSQNQEAVEAFEQAIRLNPDSLRAHFHKGSEPSESFGEGLTEGRKNALQWLWKADCHRTASEPEQAISCFQKALSLCEDEETVWTEKGKLLADLGQYQEALNCFEKALSINPRAIEIWDCKGSLLMKMNNYNEACDCFNESLSCSPTFKWALYHKGLSLFNMEQYREAVQIFSRVIELDAECHEAWLGTGDCYRKMQKRDEALQAYKSAIDLQTDTVDAWLLSIETLKDESRWEEALILVKKAMEIAPEDTTLALDHSEILFHLGYYGESRRTCEKILKCNPSNEDCQHLFQRVSRYEKEQKALLSSIYATPQVPLESLNRDLNSLLSVFCSVKAAISHLQRCAAEDARSSYLLAALYYLDGDYDAALAKCNNAAAISQLKEKAARLRESILSAISNKAPADTGKKSIFQIAKSFLKKESDSADEIVIRGFEKMRSLNLQDVRAYLREVLGKNPVMYSFVYLIALTYEMEMNSEKAKHYYNELSRLVPLSTGIWEKKLINRLDTDPKEAEQAYEKLTGSYPYIFPIWMEYLKYLSLQGNYMKLKLLSSALLSDDFREWDRLKEAPDLLNFRGFLQLHLGRFSQAHESFSKALDMDLNNAISLIGMAISLSGRRLFEEAAEHLKSMLSDERTHAAACYLMVDLFIKERQEMKALGTLDEALLKYPDYLPFMYQKALVCANLNMYSEMDEIYSSIISHDPAFIPVRVLRSNALVERGQLKEGAAEMMELISHSKGNAALLGNLGFIYIKAKRYDEAISTFNSVAEIAPLCHEAYLGAAIAYYLKGNREKVREYFQKALELIPDSVEASLARSALSGNDPELLLLRHPLSLIEPFHLFQLLSFPSLKAIEIPPLQDPAAGD